MKKPSAKSSHPKKELKKQLAGKIQLALADLKDIFGEQEFHHRAKKAARVFVQGLHAKDLDNGNAAEQPGKEAVQIKTVAAKTTPKNVKKAAKKALKK